MDSSALRRAPSAHRTYIKFLYALVLASCVVIYSTLKAHGPRDVVGFHASADERAVDRHLLQSDDVEVCTTHVTYLRHQCALCKI